MGSEGWYNDEAEPALARWFDGTAWTEHTIVKASWTGPGEPPPPQQRSAVAVQERWIETSPPESDEVYAPIDEREPEYDYPYGEPVDPDPFAVGRIDDPEDDDDDLTMWGSTPVGAHFASSRGGDPEVYVDDDGYRADGYRVGRTGFDLNRFGAPLAGVAALVVALIAFQLVRSGDSDDPPTEQTTSAGDIDEAVESARQGLAVEVTDGDLKALIRGLCDVAGGGAVGPVADDAAIAVSDPAALSPVLAAAARGAADYCPGDTAGTNGAIDDVLAAAAVRVTTTTAAPVVAVTTQPDASASAASSPTRRTTTPASSGTTRSSSGGVVRTETRSQSSTNPSLPSGNANSSDQTDVGNVSDNRQVTNTVVSTPPSTEAPPDTAPSPEG